MKSKLLVVLFVFIAAYSHAQKLDVGFELGPQFTFGVAPDTAASNKGIKMGLRYGLHLDWNFSNRFAFNTGVYGNLVGAKIDYLNDFYFEKSTPNYHVTTGSRVNYLFNYVEVPMNIMMKTNELGHKISIYALTGFSNRFMVASKTKVTSAAGVESDKFRTYKDMRFYDIPFNFGAGITYRIKDDFKGIFGLQYSHGLIDITKRDANKVTISSLMLSLGVLF